MIKQSMKKILSGIIIATYFVVYTAPMGFCLTGTTPKIDTGIVKPVLRGTAKQTALKLEGDISISKGNPKVSLSLRDSDVEQVLRMFADKAGLNIIFHDSVSGKVTLDLVNVPLNDAFRMVMQVTSLTYYIDHNTMVIISAEAAKTSNLTQQEMMSIPVQYSDAVVLADFLNKNIFSTNRPGLSNSQVAITNPSTNEILIFGTKNDYLMAKKIVAQFDKKPQEETFVVNHTTPKEMATLLCSVVFQSHASTSGGGGSSSGSKPSSSSSSSSSTPSSAAKTGPSSAPSTGGGSSSTGGSGSSSIPGLPTGGAADSSGSSSSGGTTTGTSGSTASLALGGGVTACQYNNAVDTGSLSSMKVNSLSITYFPQRGTIEVLGGSAQQMEMIREYIAKNDKKQPQAYLEVSIIELNESGSREFNNNWQIWSNFFSGSFDGTLATNPLYPNFLQGDGYKVVDSSTNPPTVKQIFTPFTGTPTLTYSMDYLISNSKGRVLANPRIMITNGQTSKIDLSSDYVKTVTSQIVTSTVSSTPTVQKTYNIANDNGIVVELVPFISPEGYVTLNIKPNYSTISEQIHSVNGSTSNSDLVATLLQRRNLDLKNIRIKDGETLVIGGMIRETETKTVAKLPVLGDLPGVGFFFRNTSSGKEKQELVIMITPKIIKDTQDMVHTNTDATL